VRLLGLFAFLSITLYLIVLAIFFLTQRKLLYFPARSYISPAEAHANRAFIEIPVKTQDGIELRGWYAPATSSPCTIVFFHGNGDSLSTAAGIAEPYIIAGYGFFLAEYRGYSGLPGAPAERGLYHDARAYLQSLKNHGVDSRNIVLYGHSLGTGVAVQMASEYRTAGLMLLAPYLSIPKVAQIHFPFFPSSILALDRFDNEKKIKQIHSPLLIGNGSEDAVVPPSQGEKLYSLANGPKEFHSLPGLGHNDAFEAFTPLSLSWLEHNCR